MKVTVRSGSSIRRYTRRVAGVVVLSGLVALVSAGLQAQPPQSGQQGSPASEQQAAPGPVNQRQALERVRALYQGNVISINEVRQGNRVRYRVRIDNEGNVFTVFVDQATGRVSRE